MAGPSAQTSPGVAELTFLQFNKPTFSLRYPLLRKTLDFVVPYRWVIQPGLENSYIEVHFDMQVDDAANPAGGSAPGAGVDVYVNNVLAASMSAVSGDDQRLRVPIPAEALRDPTRNRHRVTFALFVDNCLDVRPRFTVRDTSVVHLSYREMPLSIDLADFPRPLTHDLPVPESIAIIVPDTPSDADLSAAASVSAAVGRRASSTVQVDLLTAVEATPARLVNTSAIVVGQPKDNAFLRDLYQRNRLPTTLSPDGASIVGTATHPIAAGDGVLQEVLSDVATDQVYLVVAGNDEAGVARAARALSVLEPRYGVSGSLAVIQEIGENEIRSDTAEVRDTFTLAELGLYEDTLVGIGTQSIGLSFFIPASWRLTEDARLTLTYLHSATLQPGLSGLTVRLNGKAVGSVPVDQTTFGQRQEVLELSPDEFNPGEYNRLSFEGTLHLEQECVFHDTDLAWIRVLDRSELVIPHAETEDAATSLGLPLLSFTTRQDLSDVWFVLPEDPTRDELQGVIRLSRSLGSLSEGAGFRPRVSRGPVVDPAGLAPYRIIAVGRPTLNPVIAAANEQLPQPFMPGEDNLRQKVGGVIYRLPDDFSVGVVQLLISPWNAARSLLAVTGTTQEGVDWALRALGDNRLVYDLTGNLSFAQGDQIESFDTLARIGRMSKAVEAALAEATPVAPTPAPNVVMSAPTTQSAQAGSQAQAGRDSEVPLLVVIGLVGAGLAIAVAGAMAGRRKATPRR